MPDETNAPETALRDVHEIETINTDILVRNKALKDSFAAIIKNILAELDGLPEDVQVIILGYMRDKIAAHHDMEAMKESMVQGFEDIFPGGRKP